MSVSDGSSQNKVKRSGSSGRFNVWVGSTKPANQVSGIGSATSLLARWERITPSTYVPQALGSHDHAHVSLGIATGVQRLVIVPSGRGYYSPEVRRLAPKELSVVVLMHSPLQ